jgi:hypothetical protein
MEESYIKRYIYLAKNFIKFIRDWAIYNQMYIYIKLIFFVFLISMILL